MRIWVCCLLGLCLLSGNAAGQSYMAMPADSGASWRYRSYDIDALTQVYDYIIFTNGTDTLANNHLYHKLMVRTCRQAGGPGFDPPVVTVTATLPDTYYGAIRDSMRHVYQLTVLGESPLFDFSAVTGDSIPDYSGKVQVTGIDSIVVGGGNHRRYLTTDTGYYALEGIGSNRGLFPGLNDGSGMVRFYCFNYGTESYSPGIYEPCTDVYPYGYSSEVSVAAAPAWSCEFYPDPATDFLHLSVKPHNLSAVTIYDRCGRKVWQGDVNGETSILVEDWPGGVYFVKVCAGTGEVTTGKFVIAR